MENNYKEKVVEALVNYVIRVSSPCEAKTPEEVTALPSILQHLLRELSGVN